MIRAWIAAAAAGGFGALAAGTIAAHLAAAGGSKAELLRTGALYAMVHAAALLGVAALAERRGRPGRTLAAAGWCLAFGLLVFSFSLYAVAATGLAFFGYLTPFGGLGLLAGWAALAADAALRR
jgi:uncharacterized membrane protein YgdD (TMEM256/DUF423 family)